MNTDRLLSPPPYLLHFARIVARSERPAQELARAALDKDAHGVACGVGDVIAGRGSERAAKAAEATISAYDELLMLVRELRELIEEARLERGLAREITQVENDIALARLWIACIVGLAMQHPAACEKVLAGNLHRGTTASAAREVGIGDDIIPWTETTVENTRS